MIREVIKILGNIGTLFLANSLTESENLEEVMKMSEISFSEWDNDEDEVYDNL